MAISKDEGVKAVLAKRMIEERLPKALAMKEKVDRGGFLDDLDLRLLETVVSESRTLGGLVDDDPTARGIAERMMALYKEIADKALSNERDRPATP